MKYPNLGYMKNPFYLPFLLIFSAMIGAAYFWDGHKPAVTAELVNVTTTRIAGDTPGEADSVEFRVRFKVTAFGGDAFLDGRATRGFADSPAGSGFGWALSPESTLGSPSVIWVGPTPSDGLDSRDVATGSPRFRIAEGHTRNFDFRVWVETTRGGNGATGVQVDSIRWAESPDGSAENFAVFDREAFRTDLVAGLSAR